MVINGLSLFHREPIKNMLRTKVKEHGVSHGLAEVGYDIRIKQEVRFTRDRYPPGMICTVMTPGEPEYTRETTRFTLASAIEEFQMPHNMVGIVHDKSTWARHGLSVFNTVIEPGWKGFLTLELVYHGNTELVIPAGAGIAQVIFHGTQNSAEYQGKYQNQADLPIHPIMES